MKTTCSLPKRTTISSVVKLLALKAEILCETGMEGLGRFTSSMLDLSPSLLPVCTM